ncbi:Ca2+-dependent phosphoinositide-specific phospholipase C [Porticoccus sp. GXU_MW_L64]
MNWNRMRKVTGAAVALAFLLQACSSEQPTVDEHSLPDNIPINQLQNIGTHNSYHLFPYAGVAALAKELNYRPGDMSVEEYAHGFDYQHPSLTAQLELGVRHFEIDIYNDPEGGRFANFGVYPMLRNAGLLSADEHHDPDNRLSEPGIKVFHLPETDFRSTCLLFKECLAEIKAWSDANPYHVPLMIQLEPKEKSYPAINPEHADIAVLPHDAAAWKRLEAEILTVFPRQQLMTPDDVRGDSATLYAAISEHGWPQLGTVRGKVFFTLDNRGSARDAYLQESANLQGRLLFADVDPGHPAAAFMVKNDPFDIAIPGLVEQGYLIRTRADANTDPARNNDNRQRDQAFVSGAHFITTDYPTADERFSSYRVVFDDGSYLRVRSR